MTVGYSDIFGMSRGCHCNHFSLYVLKFLTLKRTARKRYQGRDALSIYRLWATNCARNRQPAHNIGSLLLASFLASLMFTAIRASASVAASSAAQIIWRFR